MTELLFDRTAEVVVGVPGQAGKGITDIRIQFDVEKTNAREPNALELTLTNLSSETISLFEADNAQVSLSAGYGGRNSVLYVGDVDIIRNKKQGVDRQTIIECGDGKNALQSARVSLSFDEGATHQQVIDKLAGDFELDIGDIIGDFSASFSNGLSMSGSFKSAMDRITKAAGAEWTVRDNELIVLAPDTPTGEQLVLLTPRTGLLGTPTKTESGWACKSFLNPKINIGRAVNIESNTINASRVGVGPIQSAVASVKVTKLKHKGDTHDVGQDTWLTDFEADLAA